MMIALRPIAFLLLILLLASCAVVPQTRPKPAASNNPAVVALLDKAHSQSAAGDLEQAGASLERALRIEPRNALLWQELARVRLDMGLYRQAESLAAKSNGFAAANRTLREKTGASSAKHEAASETILALRVLSIGRNENNFFDQMLIFYNLQLN